MPTVFEADLLSLLVGSCCHAGIWQHLNNLTENYPGATLLELTFVDIDPTVVKGLRQHFAAYSEVSIIEGDILDHAENTLVSPANSNGYMDGGIDAVYQKYFGSSIQRGVHAQIDRRREQRLPVGAAELVLTGHEKIPYLIVAPTMEGPAVVDPVNAGAAMFAVLRLSAANQDRIKRIYCPGLATGIGAFDPAMIDAATKDMAFAYGRWLELFSPKTQ